jgi:hypothetical protein
MHIKSLLVGTARTDGTLNREKKKQQNLFDLVETVHAPEYSMVAPRIPPEPTHRFEVTLEPSSFSEEKYVPFDIQSLVTGYTCICIVVDMWFCGYNHLDLSFLRIINGMYTTRNLKTSHGGASRDSYATRHCQSRLVLRERSLGRTISAIALMGV